MAPASTGAARRRRRDRPGRRRPGRSPAVADGRATPQDQASQAVVACSTRSRASGCSTSPPRRAARRRPSPSASGDRLVVAARRRRRPAPTRARCRAAIGHRQRRSCGRATAEPLPFADGHVRPGAGRRAVQRPRRAAAPARRALAPRGSRRSTQLADAPASLLADRGAEPCGPAAARVLGVHAHRRRDGRRRRRGRSRRCPTSSPLPAAGDPWRAHGAGRCCSRRTRAPTACSSSRSAGAAGSLRTSVAQKIAPSILSADFARARRGRRRGSRPRPTCCTST